MPLQRLTADDETAALLTYTRQDTHARAGLAWQYTQYSSSRLLARLQKEAQQQKLGLWEDPNPMLPWQWRRPH